MAPQHDFILDNQNGAQFRADVNLALEAIATVSSGAVEPTTTYAYQYWADTTTGYLKQRDASNANWIVKGNLAADYGQAGQVLTSAGAGVPAIWTSITEDGAWTVAQDSTNAHFTFTGNGFDGTETNPDIYLIRGAVYNFTNASTTKGFQIQSTAGLSGTAYNDGITTNPALAPDSSTVSTLVWTVQMDAPSELYYHSTVDAGPGGNIYILDAAGGGSELEWTLTANGTTDYIFAGPGFAGTETDPDLYVVRGQTYKFTNSMGAHPFQIQSTQGTSGTAYSDGITNNAVSNGTLIWEVRMDAPSTLYYQCTAHADMNGTIRVLDVSSTVASIDDLSDVDTSTVAPTDGQALVWDNTNSQWEPGTISGGGGTTLPAAQDGEALIYENGQWVAGPVIGGVDYTTGSGSQATTYTPPTGFSHWNDVFLLSSSKGTLSNNDLISTQTATGELNSYSTTTKNTGKWYWEIEATTLLNGDGIFGIVQNPTGGSFPGGGTSGGIGIKENGTWWTSSAPSGTSVTNVSSTVNGDIMMFALDADASKLWFGKNGTWDNSGDPAAGTGDIARGWSNTLNWYFAVRGYQIGTTYEKKNYASTTSTSTVIPYSIDKLDDVDTSTVAPTDGQALVWDAANSKWEPGTVSGGGGGTSLPAAQDGEALIYENGQWVAGPVIGGVDYTTGGGDGSYSNVELLMLANGTNASTTFTDSSSNSFTLTAGGSAQISTAQSKFGGASAYLSTTSDNISAPSSSGFAFGTGDFTVECWYRPVSRLTNYPRVWSFGANEWSSNDVFVLNDRHFGDNTKFSVYVYAFSSTNPILTSSTTVSDGTWYHLAVIRDGNTFRLFVDGVEEDTYTNTNSVSSSSSIPFFVGARSTGSATQGYIDDLRVTKGVARYTAAFTPPTAELPASGSQTTILASDSIRTLLGIDEYASDSAAGTGGVASGALYYNTTSSDYRLKS